MKRQQLVTARTTLLREAEALKGADGTFADDAIRAAFDAKMAEIERIDAQIRAIDAAPQPAQPDDAAIRAAAATAERERITGIQTAVRVAKLAPTVAEDFILSLIHISEPTRPY